MTSTTMIPTIVVVCAGLVAAFTDVWKYKVYNTLTLPLLFTGLVFHAIVGGWSGLGFSLGGAVFGFAVLIVFYGVGGVGAGDVKLLAGIGAWLGLLATAEVFLLAGLAVGVYSLVLMLVRRSWQSLWAHLVMACYPTGNLPFHLTTDQRVEEVVGHDDRRSRLVPFGALLAVGVVGIGITHHVFGASLMALPLGG